MPFHSHRSSQCIATPFRPTVAAVALGHEKSPTSWRPHENTALGREEGRILVEVEAKQWKLKCGAFREPALVRVFRVSRRRFSCLRQVTRPIRANRRKPRGVTKSQAAIGFRRSNRACAIRHRRRFRGRASAQIDLPAQGAPLRRNPSHTDTASKLKGQKKSKS